MEALLGVIVLVLLAVVLANTSDKNDRLEVENEAYRVVLASMQRDNREVDTGNGAKIVLALLGLLVVLVAVAVA